MSKDANILIDGFTPLTSPSIEAILEISNNGASDFTIKSSDNVIYNDPTLTLVRGKTYEFDINSPVILSDKTISNDWIIRYLLFRSN